MYSPIHAAAGLLIAQYVPNPLTALVTGVASHYLLDAIPHGDTNFGEWLTGKNARRRIISVEIVDLGTAAIVVLALLARHPEHWWVTLVAGAFGGILPDLLWGLRFVLDQASIHIPIITTFLRKHDRWHSWGHAKHPYDIPFAVGLAIQCVVLSLVFLLHL